MKGLPGLRLFCLIAIPLTLGLAEEVVTTNDLKTVDQSLENKETVSSRSGAVSERDESVESELQSELNDPKTTIEAKDTVELLSDTKRFLTADNFKDIVLNRPGDFTPQAQIMNYPSPVYLGTVPANGRFTPSEKDLLLSSNYPLALGPSDEGLSGTGLEDQIPNTNVQNANQILSYNGVPSSDMSANQVLVGGTNNQGIYNAGRSSGFENDEEESNNNQTTEAYSRLIPLSERIMLHKIPGAQNLVTCSREGELHNFWSSSHQCLVCACIRDLGMLRPVCASCAGCMASNPGIVVPEVIPSIPEWPSDRITPATVAPIEEKVTCSPLPSGQPFENPLHPCQVCICIESLNAYGQPDVHIKCQENPQCVLPTDVTVIPSIPDVPVASPYCDKFPLNVLFPHPSDSCKTCQCSVRVSQSGAPEKQVTCLPNPDCIPDSLDPVIITELPTPEAYPHHHLPEPDEQIVPITPDIIEIGPLEPTRAPWTPAPIGPLPGPSPHDSCRPYIPNQPFQHPWDECQMCVCTESTTKRNINIEVNCFTKKSCCIEPPFDIITPSAVPAVTHQPIGKLKIQDAICEYKTFGVQFTHPKDQCNVCTCELRGNLISPFCKRSSKPECQPIGIYPTTSTIELPVQSGISSYNTASQSQNKANAYVSSYRNPYTGSVSGTSMGSSQSSADQHASSYNQWNLQNVRPDLSYGSQKPRLFSAYGPQNLPSGSNYRPQNLRPQTYPGAGFYSNRPQGYNGYPLSVESKPGYQVKPGYGYQNYPGYRYQPGVPRPGSAEFLTQAQTKASASASAGYQSGSYYSNSPGYYPQGYPGLKSNAVQQYAQNSASAQSQAQASSASGVRLNPRNKSASGLVKSGNPADADNESSEE